MVMRKYVAPAVFAGCLVLCVDPRAAPAAVVPNLNGGAQAGETFYDSQVVATDLVNAGRPTLGSVVAPASSGTTFSAAGLNDGAIAAGVSATKTYYQTSATPATVTFNLNTNAGTGGSPAGYNITSIRSYAGWTDSNIGAQSFELKLSTVAVPALTSYGTFTNTSGFAAGTTGTSLATLTTLTDSTGTIASGVTAVQLIYTSPTTLGVPQGASNGGTVIREIDVAGTPTPEPGSLTLLAAGSLGLLARRPRRR